MSKFSVAFVLYFLFATTSTSGSQCKTNVDDFTTNIFKRVSVTLNHDDLVALSEIKGGSCAPRRVYFSAYLSSHTPTSLLTPMKPIIFSEVITNEGGAYNASTGAFTAPITGAYSFFWEFLVFPNGTVVLELQKNNVTFAHGYAHGADKMFEVSSRSTILNLDKGDTVRVVFHSGSGKLHGDVYNKYTGFSGYNL